MTISVPVTNITTANVAHYNTATKRWVTTVQVSWTAPFGQTDFWIVGLRNAGVQYFFSEATYAHSVHWPVPVTGTHDFYVEAVKHPLTLGDPVVGETISTATFPNPQVGAGASSSGAFGAAPDTFDSRDLSVYYNPNHVVAPGDYTITDLPNVYSQGSYGTCASNATATATAWLRTQMGLTPDFDPARDFLFRNAIELSGAARPTQTTEDAFSTTDESVPSSTIRSNIVGVADFGCLSEADYPYNRPDWNTHPSQAVYDEAADNLFDFTYQRVATQYVYSVLRDGNPIIFSMGVPDRFDVDAGQNGVLNAPQPNDNFNNGHAMLIVGSRASDGYLRVRNSWGTSWGDGGEFWMHPAWLTDQHVQDMWVMSDGGIGDDPNDTPSNGIVISYVWTLGTVA